MAIMTPAELTAFREELRMDMATLARVLGVDKSTVPRWEAGTTKLHPLLPFACAAIRHMRLHHMAGQGYPLMGDVLALVQGDGVTQDLGVRLFGVEP
jgi:DNA-binding XRE family transcriptional regulator